MSDVLRPRAATGAPAPSGSSLVKGLIRTARPRHWLKNVLVFAAPAAAGVLTQADPFARTLLTFVIFCVVASGTYFMNDAIDAEADRAHPVKRLRPIAAGTVPVRLGFTIGVVLLVAGTAATLLLDWRLTVVVATYVAVQFAYSMKLKHLPIYDIACVAGGFLLRAIAGGVAVKVPVSQWFLIVAAFGSLLMVVGKRLAEQIELQDDGHLHRATLGIYSPAFLRTLLAISAGGAILGYSLWAFDLQTAVQHHSDPIWYQLSIVPMFIALLRYTFLVEQGHGARPEELIVSDRSMQVMGAAWAVLFALGVYAN